VIKGAKTDCYILFVENNYFAGGSKTGNVYHKVQQAWAVAYVKQDFGRILIRRETLADKIIELVHPVEIDFADDKPFSDTFYVLANDVGKATAAINRNFRNAVMDIRADNFVIEVIEHSLLIGNRETLSPEKTVHLAEFIERVANQCC